VQSEDGQGGIHTLQCNNLPVSHQRKHSWWQPGTVRDRHRAVVQDQRSVRQSSSSELDKGLVPVIEITLNPHVTFILQGAILRTG